MTQADRVAVAAEADPPRVELVLTDLPSGTVRVRIWRAVGGDTASRVRGDSALPILAGTARIVDYDAPVGRPVTYRVEAIGSTGQPLAVLFAPAPVSLPAPARSWVWLSDPLAPTRCFLLHALEGTMPADVYGSPRELMAPIGARRPVALAGQRTVGTESTWVLMSADRAEQAAVARMVTESDVLLVRAGPDDYEHPTGTVYLSADEIDDTLLRDVDYWTIKGAEVRAPGAPVVVAAWTYGDALAVAATYGDSRAMFPIYLDLTRGAV